MRFFGASDPSAVPQYGGHLRAFYEAAWRPAVGWIGTGAIALAFVIAPALNIWQAIKGRPLVPVPDLSQTLSLMGMTLGMGGLRTWEKLYSVATPTDGAPQTVINVNPAA